jgi:hypothetical protein
MKAVWVVAAALSLQACVSSSRSVQVAVVDAELVRIDTLFRYKSPVKLLTWRSSDQVEYFSYAQLNEPFNVGARMPVLMRR